MNIPNPLAQAVADIDGGPTPFLQAQPAAFLRELADLLERFGYEWRREFELVTPNGRQVLNYTSIDPAGLRKQADELDPPKAAWWLDALTVARLCQDADVRSAHALLKAQGFVEDIGGSGRWVRGADVVMLR